MKRNKQRKIEDYSSEEDQSSNSKQPQSSYINKPSNRKTPKKKSFVNSSEAEDDYDYNDSFIDDDEHSQSNSIIYFDTSSEDEAPVQPKPATQTRASKNKNTIFNQKTSRIKEMRNKQKSQEERTKEQIEKKSSDSEWLKKVVNHLEGMSVTLKAKTFGGKFMELKKQWGFTGNFVLTDFDITDCTTCGHEHVAALFEILNIETGERTDTGSQCIRQFLALGENDEFLSEDESFSVIDQAIKDASAKRSRENNEIKRLIN